MNIRDGKSQRAISRETGIDRKTVSKYIKEYESQKSNLLGTETSNRPQLIESIVAPPIYDVSSRRPTKITVEMIERINYYLKINESNLKMGLRKQLMNKYDIHAKIVEDGFDISYSSICQTISKLIIRSNEAYIRAVYEPGDVCEFDWGDVKLWIYGVLKIYQMAVFTSAYGNYRFAVLYPKQKTEFFQAAHAEFFSHIGGNYKTVVYDNMKTAVRSFVGNEKQPTDGLLKLSIYYCFKHRFCNARRGNEKGHVEKSVEYIRNKAFSFKTEFNSLEEANEHLLEMCTKLNNKPQKMQLNKTAAQLLEEERPYLLPKLPPFEVSRIERHRVNKYSCITFENCYYSVPDNLVGKLVEVRAYTKQLMIIANNEKTATHNRLYGSYLWSLDIFHYLKTLSRKPGALSNSLALTQMESGFKHLYSQYFTDKQKDFIEVLLFSKNKNITLSQIDKACRELMQKNLSITYDKLIMLLTNKDSNITPQTETTLIAINHLQIYATLMGVV